MIDKLIGKLNKISICNEQIGEKVLKNVMTLTHGSGRKAVWLYRLHDGKLLCSTTATMHQETFFKEGNDEINDESAKWLRGRVAEHEGFVFMMIYDDYKAKPGQKLIEHLKKLIGDTIKLKIDYVVDDEGYKLDESVKSKK